VSLNVLRHTPPGEGRFVVTARLHPRASSCNLASSSAAEGKERRHGAVNVHRASDSQIAHDSTTVCAGALLSVLRIAERGGLCMPAAPRPAAMTQRQALGDGTHDSVLDRVDAFASVASINARATSQVWA
jgi:hypothetical protein